MTMHRRGIKPLHVIQGYWRIDNKTKDTSAHKIPESYRNKTVNGPFIGLDPFGSPANGEVVISLEPYQHQWHHFQRAESSSQCEHCRGRTAEIQVVKSTDDTAKEKDDRGKKHRGGSKTHPQKSHPHKEKCDHH